VDIRYFVLYLSLFFWIFPAVKQYRTELFWYFLIYAALDPLVFVTSYLRLNVTIYMYSFFSILLLLSVIWPFRKRISSKLLIAASFILLTVTNFDSPNSANHAQVYIHLFITFFFIWRTFSFVAETGKANLFHLFLLMEEVSIIFKFLAVIIEIKTGVIFFYATSAFQILIAIFFTLYREDNKKLLVDLRSC